MKRGTVLALFSAGALSGLSVNAHGQTIAGPAQVVDGDTLDMTGARIRLFGIDAPEAAQTCNRTTGAWTCGQDATARLRQLVSGTQVECVGREMDIYGRLVAVCTANGRDLANVMVEGGMAVALSGHGHAYLDTEARARRFELGIWSSEFLTPADWRAAHPRQAPRPRTAASTSASVARRPQIYKNQFGCAIKGNRNRRGEWIYHLPGMPYYDSTRPEELFCTEAEAQAAGYRRSRA